MKRVKVDFSTTVRGGMIRANRERASEPLAIGDRVEAFDPGEDMTFVGMVEAIEGRFAYLRMEWVAADSAPRQSFARVTSLSDSAWASAGRTAGTQVDPESLTIEVAVAAAV